MLKSYGAVANIVGKHQKEILNNVKFVANGDGTASLHTTDMEIHMMVQLAPVSLQVEQFGECLLPVSRVYAVLRESTDDDVTIEDVGTEVILTTKSGKFKLPSANPNEYPAKELSIDAGYFEFEGSALCEAIQRTVFATDADSSRYALGGILFDVQKPSETHIVGTDGRRLSAVGIGVESHKAETHQGATLIVPSRSAGVLLRNLPRDEKVRIAFTLNEMTLQTSSLSFRTRLAEGRYPAWKQVIPNGDDWAVDATISSGAFDSLVRQAAITADSETRGLEFSFAMGNVVASATTANFGKSKVTMPIAYGGPEICTKLDYRYLRDFFAVNDPASEVRVQLRSSTEAVLLSSADGSHRYVIMPMALER